MATKRSKNERIESSGQNCAFDGCREPGNFKAPRRRDNPRDFQWMCEEHVKEFNKRWNYFEGMSQDEIYAHQKDATTGHRPTWRMDQLGPDIDHKMEEAYGRLFGDGTSYRAKTAPVSGKTRDALAQMDLEHPCAKAKIKSQYRELVKRYHPDANQGDAKAEEIFKKITLAYQHLMAHYAEPTS